MNRFSWITALLLAATIGFGVATLSGCKKKDPAPAQRIDDANKKIDDAAGEADKKIDNALDEADKKIDDAAEEIEEAADDAADAAEKKAEEAKKQLDGLTN